MPTLPFFLSIWYLFPDTVFSSLYLYCFKFKHFSSGISQETNKCTLLYVAEKYSRKMKLALTDIRIHHQSIYPNSRCLCSFCLFYFYAALFMVQLINKFNFLMPKMDLNKSFLRVSVSAWRKLKMLIFKNVCC